MFTTKSCIGFLLWKLFFPTSNRFGVFNHSKGWQNCFQTFSLVLWGRPVSGCQKVLRKVPPRFRQVWWCLWDRSVLGCQKVHLWLPRGSVEGFTKVSRRSRKFRDLFNLSGFLGQVLFRFRKGSVEGSPITSSHLSLSSLNSFFHFSPTVLALGSSAIVNVLGQNVTFVVWGSLRKWLSPSKRFFGTPNCLYIRLSVSRGFWGKWLLLQKRFCGGFRLTFISQSSWGQSGVNC